MVWEKEIYRKQILEIQEKLIPENQLYFERFYETLAVNVLGYKEDVMLETVYTLLLDLLDAQSGGETADEYFGTSSVDMAKKLLEKMQRESPQYMIKLLTFIGSSALFWTYFSSIHWFSSKPQQFSWLVWLLSAFVYLIVAILFYKIMLIDKLRKNRFLNYVVLFLIICSMIGTLVLISLLLKEFQVIFIPTLISKALGGILFVIYGIGAFKWYQTMA